MVFNNIICKLCFFIIKSGYLRSLKKRTCLGYFQNYFDPMENPLQRGRFENRIRLWTPNAEEVVIITYGVVAFLSLLTIIRLLTCCHYDIFFTFFPGGNYYYY